MGGAGAIAACAAGQAAIAGQRPGTHGKCQLSHWAGEPHLQKTGRFWNEGLAVFHGVCYTPFGLRNAAKGGAPWRHAQNMDDKNQIAREPVFQAGSLPGRTDRTLFFMYDRDISICVKVMAGYVLMHIPFSFARTN